MTDTAVIPVHLGIIMDGNRRWATAHDKPLVEGHRQGLEVFKDISLAAFDRGVKYVSAYVFSTENWQRTQEEVSYLMTLVVRGVEKHLDTFHRAGVRLLMLGSREGVDSKVLKTIDQATAKTAANTRGTLALCFNYGGQEEIAQAANQLTKPITADNLAKALYAPDIPALDFVIRTSGEQRLSGFMLWRAAYAELYFTGTLWPDFTEQDLDKALSEYARRQRRFGS